MSGQKWWTPRLIWIGRSLSKSNLRIFCSGIKSKNGSRMKWSNKSDYWISWGGKILSFNRLRALIRVGMTWVPWIQIYPWAISSVLSTPILVWCSNLPRIWLICNSRQGSPLWIVTGIWGNHRFKVRWCLHNSPRFKSPYFQYTRGQIGSRYHPNFLKLFNRK